MKTRRKLLEAISNMDILSRGKLCVVATAKSGKKFYSLQYRHHNRHFVKYVASGEVAAYEKATSNFTRLRDLFDCYVEEMSARTIREIEKGTGKCRSRKS